MDGLDPYAGTGAGRNPGDRDCDECKEPKHEAWGTCYHCPLSPSSAVQSFEAVAEKPCGNALFLFVNRLFSIQAEVKERGRPRVTLSRLEARGLRVLADEIRRFDATAAERFQEKQKRERAMRERQR